MTTSVLNKRTRLAVPGGLTHHAGLIGLLIVLAIFTATQSDAFLTGPNLLNVVRQISVVAVLAASLTLLMTAGGIDFSLASLAGVSAGVLARLLEAGVSELTAVALTVGVGITVGLLNGAIITASGVAPFVVTLGTATALEGVALLVIRGQSISIGQNLSGLGFGEVVGIPVLSLIALAVCVGVGLVMRYTTIGRHAFAIGGNEAAARLSGIPVTGVKLALYGLNGALAAIGGTMLLARLGAASPGTAGLHLELTVVAAVVIGGTALAGGSGTIIGTVLGVILLGVVANALNLLQIDSYYQQVSVGAVLLVAAVANQVRRRHSG
ncbi:ABC transporter permease [Solwaraspora sp. WMMD937]|uniref:ABC transporter permease n=1 Tax=Solwaraspora sp. WMMD937 TaxID=3016090 RepID=UPI00249B8833|nr:ABC transporter permease [Solwaraspora sp. WMMD937]WFE22551.1 ABC transporter permease [Solwaraspora sp. WMMD937]